MEKPQSLKPTTALDTSKYNLRCNRNISEKMTKKDFIYDIPAPFQTARKEKSFQSPLKKHRGDIECLIKSNAIIGSQLKGAVKGSEGKLNKNPVGLLRLIQPRKLIPGITNGRRSLNPGAESRGKERIVKEPERPENEGEIRRKIVLPIQLRRKIGPDTKPPRYSVIPNNEERQLDNSKYDQVSERKILGHQCNYCEERLATFLSLSTHVKQHCRRYCTTCFWILDPEESMTQHVQKAHPVNGPAHVPVAYHT